MFRGVRPSLVSGLSSGLLSSAALPESSTPPEGVVWSDDGSVAVLYSGTGAWIQILTGLPASINPGAPIDISALGGALIAIAADASGQHIAVGVAGDQAGVYQTADGQNFSPLLNVSRPVSLAYSADSSALYALDGATNQVSEINLASSATQTWPLDLDDAAAIRPAHDSANRTVLYVAGRKSRLLVAYDDRTHQSIASVPLSFDPVMIEPIGGNGFLLSRRTANTDPLWSFTNATQPMVYFVPATPIPADSRPEVRPR